MKDIIEILKTVKEDCEIQYNSLDQNNDVKWDCYDKDNWESMTYNLNNAIEALQLKLIKKEREK